MQRWHSNSTIALNDMCTEQDLTCVSSVYDIDFTYVSDVNGTYSTTDHFIIYNSLNTCVNNYCTVNDIDNMSDHLPLCMYIHLPVNIMYLILFLSCRYTIPIHCLTHSFATSL